VMLESKLPVSELSKDMKTYPQLLKNVRVKNKKLAREDEEVIKAVEEATKELNGNGRILLRESGTEPVIRVMAEADSMEKCEKVVGRIVDVIAKQGHVC
ncbi:MAG: phosphoglucosamine mutase, partial [Lachnospiraceae bacterium]|nr:phosphoglucosamine mutase [Lachnospiraceae bacterium]